MRAVWSGGPGKKHVPEEHGKHTRAHTLSDA